MKKKIVLLKLFVDRSPDSPDMELVTSMLDDLVENARSEGISCYYEESYVLRPKDFVEEEESQVE